MSKFQLYNTLTRKLEDFEPAVSGRVGMYVCGPTVYGPPHLGHTRGPILFDVLRRFMEQQGWSVRFVKNITDVGHLVGDGDEGEDKLQKQARLEQIEPMEVAQSYTDAYNAVMDKMNVRRPSIEPKASGHIIEQIEMIQTILSKGLAYESKGSVYFDVAAYAKDHHYGELSGRVIEELMAGAGEQARSLEGQEEKRNANDFALWKKASPEHIMQWSSPWGKGYPGWHIECSAMSAKYLGTQFDIHGGGMDLLFPHHEGEIAQSCAAHGVNPARFWVHHNMITINGQKMSKSLNNGILAEDLFSGNHALLAQPYSPMTLRFFVLQAHYRSTLDFSNDALQAAQKGLQRMQAAWKTAQGLKASASSSLEMADLHQACAEAMRNDLATPQVIAHLFEWARRINLVNDGRETLDQAGLDQALELFRTYYFEVLGMQLEGSGDDQGLESAMQVLLDLRAQAKADKNYALSDSIRDRLAEAGFQIKDGKDGSSWSRS
ncbi:MAG: cysteine--tRNA ligase [Bacteroidia bacterium]